MVSWTTDLTESSKGGRARFAELHTRTEEDSKCGLKEARVPVGRSADQAPIWYEVSYIPKKGGQVQFARIRAPKLAIGAILQKSANRP